MTLRTFAATVLMIALFSGLPPSRMSAAQPAQARQPATPEPAPREAPVDWLSAETTRERFRDLLRDYPPSLTQVLKLDPSLMANANYLAPYPGLSSYLAQHPEVLHNPRYFLGDLAFGVPDARRSTIDAIKETMAGLAMFLFFMTALAVVAHAARSVLEHRRWMHATRIQTDAHTKLVDRLASNEDLLAYVQSPAGQRFLSVTPVALNPEPRFGSLVGAPISRILTSVQVGIVAAFGGAGLWIAKNQVIEEVAQPLHVVSILAIALGLGFVLSALLSWALSKQMGLLDSTTTHA